MGLGKIGLERQRALIVDHRLIELALRAKRITQLEKPLCFFKTPCLLALHGLTSISSARLSLCHTSLIDSWLSAISAATPLEFFTRATRTGVIASRIRH